MMKQNTQKGFTIIETLVSIFILTIAISATLSAAQLGLQSSYYARDQITAFYLAEEAIEQIRNVRDTNYITSKTCGWLTGGDSSIGCVSIPATCIRQPGDNTPKSCKIDVEENIDAFPSNAGMSTCTGSACTLLLDPNHGYNYVSGDLTHFSRTVDIKLIQTDASDSTSLNDALITVTVTWSSGPFSSRSIILREELYNWNSGNHVES